MSFVYTNKQKKKEKKKNTHSYLKSGSIRCLGGGILPGVQNGSAVKDEDEDGRPAGEDGARRFGRRQNRGHRIRSEIVVTTMRSRSSFRRQMGKEILEQVVVVVVVVVRVVFHVVLEECVDIVVRTRTE